MFVVKNIHDRLCYIRYRYMSKFKRNRRGLRVPWQGARAFVGVVARVVGRAERERGAGSTVVGHLIKIVLECAQIIHMTRISVCERATDGGGRESSRESEINGVLANVTNLILLLRIRRL